MATEAAACGRFEISRGREIANRSEKKNARVLRRPADNLLLLLLLLLNSTVQYYYINRTIGVRRAWSRAMNNAERLRRRRGAATTGDG